MKRVIGILLFIFIFMILLNYQNNRILLPNNNLNTPEITLGDTSSSLITPYYSTNHFIVADYVINPSNADMTDTIQRALNTCYSSGGGTVWLNKGVYKVTKPIDIPTGCTLMGDWQDPDNYSGKLDYGTKIVVDINSFKRDNADDERSGLFRMHSSSGVEGITIYYKGQIINSPYSQPWSFYCSTLLEDLEEPGKAPGMLFTIKNVTMINSYYGIGRSDKEIIGSGMLMIENVKGTVIKKGVQYHNSGEVSTIVGLSLNPKYWATANISSFNDNASNISESTIINKIKSIGGIGLILTDSELSEYVNVNISGYKYGIYVPKRSTISARSVGSGAFYDLNISNTTIGMFVDSDGEGKKPTLSSGIGYVISNSSIEGSDYAIYISAPLEEGKRGTIKLNNVSVKGKTGGNGGLIYYDSNSKKYNPVFNVANGGNVTGKINNTGKFKTININRKLKNDGKNLITISPGSSVDTINNALNTISSKGGGVVYLQAGKYYIDKTIIIPANVELRGSFASSSYKAGKRNGKGDGISLGTILHVNSNVTAVRINGNNSGIFGIYFMYEKNIKNLGSYREYSYTIETTNTKNIYLKNITICGASHGININRVDGFTIQNVVSGIIINVIKIDNSNNGLILNCLQNGWLSDWNLLYYGSTNLNNITKNKLSNLLVHNTKNLEIQNTFAFGSNTFLTTSNSSIYAVNLGYDGLDNIFLHESNTNLVSINAFVYGNSFNTLLKINGGSIGLYNNYNMSNISINDYENNIKSNTGVKGDVNGDNRVSIADYNLIRKHILGTKLTGDILTRADVNGDGKVSVADYNLIRKLILNK
jgi:hypothetical protein